MKKQLSIDGLRQIFDYDPLTGVITRKQRVRYSKHKIGSVVGNLFRGWYWCAIIDGNRYYCHRLAWAMYWGVWPTGFIDHINGNRSDNRISNLRDVDRTVNRQNVKRAQRNNKSGLLGVSTEKGRFCARIFVEGKQKKIGLFKTAETAHAAYLEQKRILHAGCTI